MAQMACSLLFDGPRNVKALRDALMGLPVSFNTGDGTINLIIRSLWRTTQTSTEWKFQGRGFDLGLYPLEGEFSLVNRGSSNQTGWYCLGSKDHVQKVRINAIEWDITNGPSGYDLITALTTGQYYDRFCVSVETKNRGRVRVKRTHVLVVNGLRSPDQDSGHWGIEGYLLPPNGQAELICGTYNPGDKVGHLIQSV